MTRQYLSARERAALLLHQGGHCCVAGCTETEHLEGEHSTPSAWVGGKPDQLMCESHHREKTRLDVAKIAKVKRILGQTKNGPKKKIQSRGFEGHKKFDGTIVRRGN